MKEWLEMGFDPSTLRHRELLAEKILAYKPRSVLDVGCASGPDLYLLNFIDPSLELYGIELDGGDANKAGEFFMVIQGDLRDILPTIPKKSVDVVFSNGVIMYTEPKWIKEMMRIARKAVILSEKEPYNGLQFSEEYAKEITSVTHITGDIRHSWKNDGHIYEIAL